MGGLLVAVGGVLDQSSLRFLEAPGHATAGLDHGTLCRVKLLLAGHASDAPGSTASSPRKTALNSCSVTGH